MNVFSSIIHFSKYYFFSVVCLLYMFNPKNYNPASRRVLVQQIFYTAIEILPIFLLSAIVFGVIIMGLIVSLAIKYNMQQYIGYFIIKLIIVELVPFLLALVVSFRTGLRISAKTSIMKVNNELNTLEVFGIDTVKYLFMPRALGNMLGFISLVFLFSLIMMISGYVFLFLIMGMNLDIFLSILVKAISLKDILIFVFKSLLFGFIIVTIPSYDGLITKTNYFEIPLSLSKTISSLFIIICFIEVLSLIIEFI